MSYRHSQIPRLDALWRFALPLMIGVVLFAALTQHAPSGPTASMAIVDASPAAFVTSPVETAPLLQAPLAQSPLHDESQITKSVTEIATLISKPALQVAPATIGQLVAAVKEGKVKAINVEPTGLVIRAERIDGSVMLVNREPNTSVLQYLLAAGVPQDSIPDIGVTDDWLLSHFSQILALLAVVLIIGVLVARRFVSKDGNVGIRGIGNLLAGRRDGKFTSVSQFTGGTRPSVRFIDVAGIDEVKEELQEIVQFLQDPSSFAVVGARLPKGVLLSGSPGTGKTMLAKAVAGEAGVPFFSMNGSEFVEMYIGVGASRMRDLFTKAKRQAPCIVFIDEIDAVGKRRGSSQNSNEERDQTLNQLLCEMDGFQPDTRIVVVAATNRPDVLDSALLRPGRFDRQIRTDLPDKVGRLAILGVHAKGKPFTPNVDFDRLASDTVGMSGADLENIINEAALRAARHQATVIESRDVDEALERVIAGPAHKGRVMRQSEKDLVAYHEAGHALVAHLVPVVDPVRKISIVSRAGAGGYTRVAGDDDRQFWAAEHFIGQIAFGLGGMAAEELVFGRRSTGASNDLRQASNMARAMVLKYGMSEKLGPMVVDETMEMTVSPRYLDAAEQEIRCILNSALRRARSLLEAHRTTLDQLRAALLEHDSLTGSALDRILAEAGPLKAEPRAELVFSTTGTSYVEGTFNQERER